MPRMIIGYEPVFLTVYKQQSEEPIEVFTYYEPVYEEEADMVLNPDRRLSGEEMRLIMDEVERSGAK